MDARVEEEVPVYAVSRPARQVLPLVLSSPHSGRHYSAAFLAASRLDDQALRGSEDSFVEELFAGAPAIGAPLLAALFPRAYLDPNREPWELDPRMFSEPLPDWVNSASQRVAAGLGTIARVVSGGAEIYRDRLTFAEAERRVRTCHAPYHAALAGLVRETVERFGHCILLDCHSMPPGGGGGQRAMPDMVLGDCFGVSCAPRVTERAELILRRAHYRVRRNTPYAGGYTTHHYGAPSRGVHGLQIEINRALYMNPESRERRPEAMARLAEDMMLLLEGLGGLTPADLR